jgi:hypothetical protein
MNTTTVTSAQDAAVDHHAVVLHTVAIHIMKMIMDTVVADVDAVTTGKMLINVLM